MPVPRPPIADLVDQLFGTSPAPVPSEPVEVPSIEAVFARIDQLTNVIKRLLNTNARLRAELGDHRSTKVAQYTELMKRVDGLIALAVSIDPKGKH